MQQVCAFGALNSPLLAHGWLWSSKPTMQRFKVVKTAEHAAEGLVPAPSPLSRQLYKQDGGLKLILQ